MAEDKRKTEPSSFDPKPTRFPYGDYTDEHYISIKKDNGLVFDENYPYVDNSKSFLFKRKLVRLLLLLLVYPMTRIRLGLRIEGKKNIKNNKEALRGGAITISNHVHFWDYLAVTLAARPHILDMLVWAPNVRGESGALVRLMGGIPIPDKDYKAVAKFNESINRYLKDGGWLHVYPEGSMWEYYRPIRPFKTGMAYYSIKNDVPILPMAFSYRKPGWIRRNIFHQIALFTLRIGEPISPKKDLSLKEGQEDLLRRCHEQVCLLAGIDPNKNPYPSIFNHTKRIEY